MEEIIDENNIKKLIARINNLSNVETISIISFNRLEFYTDTLFEVEYSIFGRISN